MVLWSDLLRLNLLMGTAGRGRKGRKGGSIARERKGRGKEKRGIEERRVR